MYLRTVGNARPLVAYVAGFRTALAHHRPESRVLDRIDVTVRRVAVPCEPHFQRPLSSSPRIVDRDDPCNLRLCQIKFDGCYRRCSTYTA